MCAAPAANESAQGGTDAPRDAEDMRSTAPAIDLTAQEDDDAAAAQEQALVPCDKCARSKKPCVREQRPASAQKRCDPCAHGNRSGCNAQFADSAAQRKRPADLGDDKQLRQGKAIMRSAASNARRSAENFRPAPSQSGWRWEGEERQSKRAEELQSKIYQARAKIEILNKMAKHLDLGTGKEMLLDALQDIEETLE